MIGSLRHAAERLSWLHAAIVFFLLLALYLYTMPKTIALEDDGIFVLSSYFNGVSHPPGYPLHALLGKLFTLVPVGSVAARVHALSAVLGAATCGLLWWLLWRLSQNRLAAYAGALALGLSGKFWSQAIIAEVYTLNALFFVLMLLLCLRVYGDGHRAAEQAAGHRQWRALVLAAFVFGLSLSNHWPLMVLASPAFVVLLWPALRRHLASWWLLLLVFMLGLSPYLWMVWNSLNLPFISFTGPIDSVSEFIDFISRRRYAEVDTSASATLVDKLLFMRFFVSQLRDQFGWPGLLLMAAGLWGMYSQPHLRRLLLALLLAFVGNSFVLIALLGFDYDAFHRHIISVYFLASYSVAAIWLGMGLWTLWQRLALQYQHKPALLKTGTVFATVVYLVVQLNTGFHLNDRSDYDWGERYAQYVLAKTPADSILVTGNDISLGTIGYMHFIEGVRDDIRLLYDKALVIEDRAFEPGAVVGDQAGPLLRAFLEQQQRPVYASDNSFDLFNDRYWLLRSYTGDDDAPGRLFPAAVDPGYLAYVLDYDASTDYWTRLHRRYILHSSIRFIVELKLAGNTDPVLDRALTQATEDVEGYLIFADYLLQKGMADSLGGAEAILRHAGQLAQQSGEKTDRARILYYRGMLQQLEGNTRAAEKAFRDSIALWAQPQNPARRALDALLEQD